MTTTVEQDPLVQQTATGRWLVTAPAGAPRVAVTGDTEAEAVALYEAEIAEWVRMYERAAADPLPDDA